MKNIFNNSRTLLIAFFGFAVLMNSCEYQKIADADYPAQKLYMPAALNGIFTINDVPQRVEFLPTPGQAYRFTIDAVNNKLIVPLGVYRGGLNISSTVNADIATNTDTILKLKTLAKVPAVTGILPASKFTVPTSVLVPGKAAMATFDLAIDLNYLHSFPDTVFALGVGISSSQITVNPLYNTTILVLYTKILNPTANFTASIDASDKSKVTFTNTSTFQMKNLWDFGDSKTDTVKAPVHLYTASGTYNVTLTAVGVLGTINQKVKTLPVVILLLPVPNFTYLATTGNSKQINFTNSSTKCVSYSWNFGDATAVSTEAAPTHTYAAAGTYTVVLTGTGDTGATATKSVSVIVL